MFVQKASPRTELAYIVRVKRKINKISRKYDECISGPHIAVLHYPFFRLKQDIDQLWGNIPCVNFMLRTIQFLPVREINLYTEGEIFETNRKLVLAEF